MSTIPTEKLLIKKLIEIGLTQEMNREWQIQGFGMLRLYITKEVRLHVWHNGLVYHNKPSNIHNHPWDFDSQIIVGSIRNVRFIEKPPSGIPSHHVGEILCGPGGGILPNTIRDVNFDVAAIDEYTAGDVYHQSADEFHCSVFQNGTVTLVTRRFKDDADHALVAFEHGGEWQTAEPRLAMESELELGLKAALDLF